VNTNKSGVSNGNSPLAPASPAPGNAPIEHVHEHNKTKYEGSIITQDKMVNMDNTVVVVPTKVSPVPPHATPEPSADGEDTEEKPPSPPPKTPDVRFAFNIPTAENVDSEQNSVVGDHDEMVAQLSVV